MAEKLQPGTFWSIVAVEPIVHSPELMELIKNSAGASNPLSAGARKRRADFQSRYAAASAVHCLRPSCPLDLTRVRGRRRC